MKKKKHGGKPKAAMLKHDKHTSTVQATKNHIIVPIKGMHCATCALTIEKKLKKVDGIELASVNFASEKAHIEYDGEKLSEEDVIKQINKTGYKAVLETPIHGGHEQKDHSEHLKTKAGETEALKRKLAIGAVLSAIIFIGSFPEWFGIEIEDRKSVV